MKEYTYIEFNEMVEKNDLEVFSKSQVDQFSRDYLANRDTMDEFEKSCAEVDYASLTSCVVVNEDLTKSIVYYRENQTESIVPEGIFKSIDDKKCRRFKDTPLNIFKGIAGINCADKDAIEKAKGLPIGTEKTYNGKQYIKTANGWRLKPKGTGRGRKKAGGEEGGSKLDKETAKVKEHLNSVANDAKSIKRAIKDGSYPGLKEAKAAAMKAGYSEKDIDKVVKQHSSWIGTEDDDTSMFAGGKKVTAKDLMEEVDYRKDPKKQQEKLDKMSNNAYDSMKKIASGNSDIQVKQTGSQTFLQMKGKGKNPMMISYSPHTNTYGVSYGDGSEDKEFKNIHEAVASMKEHK